ncbi:hypothetical protein J3E74DRAFT_398664, partial [Bipolaris maydis]
RRALNHPQPSLDMSVDSYQPWQPPPQMDEADDELPNYQQSQEEMAERKRLEAAARARELEAQWRRTRRLTNKSGHSRTVNTPSFSLFAGVGKPSITTGSSWSTMVLLSSSTDL